MFHDHDAWTTSSILPSHGIREYNTPAALVAIFPLFLAPGDNFRHPLYIFVFVEPLIRAYRNPTTELIWTSEDPDKIYQILYDVLFLFSVIRNGLTLSSGSFYWHGLALIPARISNYTHYNVWDEIIDPFLNFNGCTVEV